MPAHQGYRAPFRATATALPKGGVARMVPSGSPGGPARVPLTGRYGSPPSSLNSDSGWARALARGAMFAAKSLLKDFGNMSGEVASPDTGEWGRLAQQVVLKAGWTRCAWPDWTTNVVCNGGVEPTIELWDWGSTGASPAACLLGQCPRNQSSAYNDPLNTTVGWPNSVNQVSYTRRTPGQTNRYDFIRTYVGPGLAGNPNLPRYVRPTVPLDGVAPRPETRGPMKTGVKTPSRVDVDGRVVAKPSVRPSTDVVFPPGRPPVIKTGEHVDEPDKVPTKKVRGVPGAMVAAIKAMHSLTELGDFVDALYEALPPVARCGGKRGLVHDLICVLEHADAFADPDVMAAAIGNLIANEVEDRVIGALFGSNWRFGGSFRPDNYGGTAWVGGGYGAPTPDTGNAGGLIQWSGSARMSPM